MQTLVHVIDRRTWKEVPTRYMMDSLFFLHFSNVYEENNCVVMDMPIYKDASLLHNLMVQNLEVIY